MTPSSILTDPAIFTEPYEFRPERWLGMAAEQAYLERYFVPFGRGQRMCLGMKYVNHTRRHCKLFARAQEIRVPLLNRRGLVFQVIRSRPFVPTPRCFPSFLGLCALRLALYGGSTLIS